MPSWRNAMGLYDPWNDDDEDQPTAVFQFEQENPEERSVDGYPDWYVLPGEPGFPGDEE